MFGLVNYLVLLGISQFNFPSAFPTFYNDALFPPPVRDGNILFGVVGSVSGGCFLVAPCEFAQLELVPKSANELGRGNTREILLMRFREKVGGWGEAVT